jgi:arylsulfatase A-like enzyme
MVLRCAAEGCMAGIAGGVLVGAVESTLCVRRAGNLHEFGVLWWGPLAYGILFAFCGLGLGCAAALAQRLLNWWRRPAATFALALGGSLAAGVATVGRWRLYADFRRGLEDTSLEKTLIWAITVLTAIVLWLSVSRGCTIILSRIRIRATTAVGATFGLVIVTLLGGVVVSSLLSNDDKVASFQPAVETSAPNVILIVADALRRDVLKLYNSCADAETPHLEALAHDGILFTQCFSQAPWTKPAFGSIFTGLYPRTHTAISQFSVLPDCVTTLAEQLLDHGFYTCALMNNPNVSSYMNFDQGFLEFTDLQPSQFCFGAPASAAKLVLYERVLRRLRRRLISSELNIHNFYQPADAVSRAALRWLDSESRPPRAPFHLMLHYMDPHDPFMSGRKHGPGYAKRDLGYSIPSRDAMVDAYIGDIEFMDRHLGSLLDGLRARGLYDNSVIVFTADHGEEFFDHEGWWHGNTLYDELIAVPLIVKLPNNLGAGGVNSHMARHIDLAPTVLQLVGISPHESMLGRSYVGRDGAFLNGEISYCFSETDYRGNVLNSVRTMDNKLVQVVKDPRGRFDSVEFYDLCNDPREGRNLAGSGDPRERSLQDLLGELVSLGAVGDALPQVAEDLPIDIIQQLKSLGYTGD